MNIKFNKKRMLALLMSGVMFVVCRGALKSGEASQEQEESTKVISVDVNEENINNTNNNSTVEVENIVTSSQFGNLNFIGNVNLFITPGEMEAKLNVNFRKGNGTEYDCIGKICGADIVSVYGISDNGWYLVSYNGVLGFAHSNYFVNKTLNASTMEYIQAIRNNMESLETPVPIQNDEVTSGIMEEKTIYEMYPNVLPLEGVMYANKNVHFRTGPSKSTDSITLIKKGQEVKLLGSDNGWYLVEYNGRVGYVSSYYVSYDRWAEYRDDFIDVVYITSDTPLLDSANDNGNAKYYFSKYEVCEVLAMNDEWYYVRYEDMYGYIRRNCTEQVANKAVVVNIDNQKLTLYENDRIVVETDVVTGTLGMFDTPTGMYYIKNKVTNTSLTSEKYGYNQPVNYWMPFNNGIGFHDANWRNKFGGNIYEKDGSHGCVNIPPEYADDVFDNVDYKTRVIVHK